MHPNRRLHRAALSLVEVLIVVVVRGIIAALALPSISNIRGVAKKTTAIQNAKSISQMSGALAALATPRSALARGLLTEPALDDLMNRRVSGKAIVII